MTAELGGGVGRLRPAGWYRLLRTVGLATAFSLPVAVLAVLVRDHVGPIAAVDQGAVTAGTNLTRADPELDRVLVIWQELFQARWVNLAGTLLCVWVWRRHGLRTRALWAFVTLMISWNVSLDVKFVVQRARPAVENAVAVAPGYSFPSGHAANTAAAGITLTVLVWPLLGPKARAVVPVAVTMAVILTALDRVLLGVHYPSDVVGGVALGGALAGASYLGYLRSNPATARLPAKRRE